MTNNTQVDLESLTLGELDNVPLETLVRATHIMLIRAVELADRSLEDAEERAIVGLREAPRAPSMGAPTVLSAQRTLENLRCAMTDLRIAFPRPRT
jgi:hypothetical protein